MSNTLQLSLTFSFKGETFSPSAVIDLDEVIGKDGEIPDLHQILATRNGIDTYSYAFEVMQQGEITFSNPTGLASECLQDGNFDFPLYIQKRHDHEVHSLLQQIATDTLNLDRLEDHPEIRQALFQAYRLGQQG